MNSSMNTMMRRLVALCFFLTQLSPQLFASGAPIRSGQSVQRETASSADDAVRNRVILKLQEQLAAFHAASRFPGATLGVALSDGSTFGLATGLSDVAAKRPMTPDDLLLQGSVGKTYVAAVALQLVGEGKLSLDDKIEKWLGRESWFARLPNAPDITVRMLMNHTSGLVRYEFNEKFTKDLTAQPDKVWKPEELISYILDTKAPFAAGQGWDYSDTNYIVLGMIIERATGSSYYAELERRILRPFGLRRTVPSNSRVIRGLVQGYAGENNPFGGTDAMVVDGKFAINPQFEWTGGGIASTSEDLASWAKLMYEGKAFKKSLLEQMLAGVPARLGPEAKYGLGVIIRPTARGLTYGHSGFFPGYITEMMYFPDLKLALAIQVNSSVPRATAKPLGRFLVELAETVKAETATAPATVQSEGRDFTELERVVQEELKANRTPGATVAIVSGDRVIYVKSFGLASVETNAPVTPEMLFRLGSTTKMFTGAALVALAAQGKIKLDEPIGNYAAGLNPKLARITAHQLISNSAGMADFEASVMSNDDDALSRMVKTWKEDAQFTEPGQVYSYSSAGFWLAGYVIEQVTKKSYADAMNELVFQPTGMTRTTLRPLVALTYPLAMGHGVRGTEPPTIIRPAYNNVAQWPAGSIYSSAPELARFAIALMNGGKLEGKQVLAPEVAAKLPGQYIHMPGEPGVHYGYGLLNFEQRGVRIVMHGGFSRGYGSLIQMSPAERFAVIVVANRSGETLPRTRNKAMEMMLKLKPDAPVKPKTAGAMSAAEMSNFAGRYVNGPQTWEIIARDGKLYYKRGGEELLLSKTAPDKLSFGAELENELAFVANARGEMEYIFDGLYAARKVR